MSLEARHPTYARWFDGRVSAAREVLADLASGPRGPRLRLLAPDDAATLADVPAREIGWPDLWSRPTPRRVIIDLGQHGCLETDDVAHWRQAYLACGLRMPLGSRLQRHWVAMASALTLACLVLAGLHRWGTPWLARHVSERVPLAWELVLSRQTLDALDGSLLKPSTLNAERQQSLRRQFEALLAHVPTAEGARPDWMLLGRSGLGANAFALPGGTIVMTDELVHEAAHSGLGDAALAGVLAHEIGHVMHRHGLRLVVEHGAVAFGLGLALGDVSSAVSGAASLLSGLAYRRAHEREADCFALALLQRAGLSPAPMAALLLHMAEAGRAGQAERDETGRTGLGDLLATHPDTGARAEQLRAGDVHGCEP